MKNTKSSLLLKTKSFFSWFDNNLLFLLTSFLIILIPLYPKIPLTDILPGYIVRLRLEDLALAFTVFVFFIQLFRKKISLPANIFTQMLFFYLLVGLASVINAIFILHTVPFSRPHILKVILHYLRRIEYFSLYFITYVTVKNKHDIRRLIFISLFTLLAVLIYGFGQKYLYWPAFSTMNREFSKGIRLYLAPESRLMSTFAGHYDYAAYLMMFLLIINSFFWFAKQTLSKLLLALLFLLAYWNLLLTSSRTSWIGYMVGLTCYFLFLIKRWGFKKSFLRWLATVFVSIFLMFTLGDLSERFLQLVNDPNTLAKYTPYTPAQIDSKLHYVRQTITKFSDFKLRLLASLHSLNQPPANSLSTQELARRQNDQLAKVAVPSDTPPRPSKPLPPDVTPQEEALRQKLSHQSASSSANHQASTSGGYSPNALKYGLSVAIRLDALWPRAIQGFKRNPLLGSGYSTLVKTNPYQFTQAESTDNDYLRMLGETGLLGAFTFLSLPFIVIFVIFRTLKKTSNTFDQAFLWGLLVATIALLVNATYIDIFESSKVAYTFWFLAALGLKYAYEFVDKN